MMLSGSDASTCGARLFEPQPIERGHRNHRPGGTSQAQGSPAISGKDRGSGRLLAPSERSAIDPDAVQDDGQFASNRNLRLLHAIAFGQPQPPSFQRAPAPRRKEQNTGRLEEIRSQQTIAPSRDLTDGVHFAQLLASRREAQIGTHGCCISEARRVVDGMAEGQCRYHADVWHGHQSLCRFV